jgi:hypothetical protein
MIFTFQGKFDCGALAYAITLSRPKRDMFFTHLSSIILQFHMMDYFNGIHHMMDCFNVILQANFLFVTVRALLFVLDFV